MKKKGFTLIELLVVIAIVGIVAGIIAPVVGRARQIARRSQCSNNLRQIGMAIHMYVDDHDFDFPVYLAPQLWPNQLVNLNYADDSEVFRCPNYKYHAFGVFDRSSYGFNYGGLNYNDGAWKSRDINYVNRYSTTSQCIMVSDGGKADSEGEAFSYTNINKWTTSRFPIGRHSNGVNILFVDGHVSWYLRSAIPRNGDPDYLLWWNN